MIKACKLEKKKIPFISTTKYFNDNYGDLLHILNPSECSSGFKTNYTSSKELNLIIKLHLEDFLPDWKNIITTFNKRSIDQIRVILAYFNKTSCIPRNIENSILLQKRGKEPLNLEGLSMFLNPIEHTKLSMTAQNVILRTKENDSASFCSIQ